MKKIFLLISFTALLQVNAQEDVEITNYVENNSYRGVKTEYEKREWDDYVSIEFKSFDSLGIITKKGTSSYKKYDNKNKYDKKKLNEQKLLLQQQKMLL